MRRRSQRGRMVPFVTTNHNKKLDTGEGIGKMYRCICECREVILHSLYRAILSICKAVKISAGGELKICKCEGKQFICTANTC